MKKLVIVLSIILALMLIFLGVRHFLSTRAEVPAEPAASASVPESDPAPLSVQPAKLLCERVGSARVLVVL